jgi:hypothetical protein
MSKTINIDVPEGFEIDLEESNLAEGKIVFKEKKQIPWRNQYNLTSGYWIDKFSNIIHESKVANSTGNSNIFATEKQAESALAMAQLSQIMQNDPRFGGPIPTEDWNSGSYKKYTIARAENRLDLDSWATYYHFLAFRTREQRDLFLKENEDLIRQYFML